ncbi:MAG: hypothetical protein K8S62_01870 [Candidatus Sabulitectum sp.]|nr:hypothetical protein [Candidatus Sabulitectum sp.]
MFNFISVKVKCPICGKSLMDKEKLIDNDESVKLNIRFNNQEDTIYLSSIYSSYNYFCETEIPNEEIVEFICPHCKNNLEDQIKCTECSAPMVRLFLIEGGKIKFCSRADCKKHSVEFEEISSALRYAYENFKYGNIDPSEKNIKIKKIIKEKQKEDKDKEVIKSGTFLRCFCPSCNKSLIEDDMIKFKIQKHDGKFGYLMISPYLNIFSHKSTIRLSEYATVKDIQCPSCEKSLMEKSKKCDKCGSKIAKVSVAAMSRMVDFYICSKKGCTWHGLSDKDLTNIILEDSEEW